jgi:HSP20 family protein
MLIQADRLHNQVFRPMPSTRTGPAWEPPVDILETDEEVLVFVALPGVDPARIETVIDGVDLVVSGVRVLPSALRTAAIHRLELPQGRFERRVGLPAGNYRRIRRSMVDGCVLIALEKTGASYG